MDNNDSDNNDPSDKEKQDKQLNEFTVLIYSIIETGVNAFVALDEETVAKLDLLDQKIIAVTLTDINLDFFILISKRKLHIFPVYEGAPNTTIKTTLDTLVNLGLNRGSAQTAVTGSLEISGELETGTLFKSILDQIEIDWEEHVSRITGDVAANQIGKLVEQIKQWGKDTYNSMGVSLSDYLTQEARLVPHALEIKRFVNDVDELRHAVDRFEAKLRRFEARSKHGSNQ